MLFDKHNFQGGGTAEGAGNYEEGEEVSLNAVANEGFEFLNWSDEDGDVVSTDIDFVYVMPSADVVITANFIIEDGTTSSVADIDGVKE